MTTPTNHYLTITDQRGRQLRGDVVYLQPRSERWRPPTAIVYIVTSDWLDPPYGYDAIYVTPVQSISGHFTLSGYGHGEGDAEGQWLFRGTFDATEASALP